MPPILKAILAISIFVVPLLAVIALLVRWENGRSQRHLQKLADELGLEAGTSIGNRLFEFPCALGYVDGFPVWVGTASDRRRGNPNQRYILFQIVVGRTRRAHLTSVGPFHLDTPSAAVPYAQLEDTLAKHASFKDLLAARTGVLDGGKELAITDDVIVRTFAIRAVQNAAWVRRVAASTRVMARYAHSLESAPAKKRAA